MTKENFEAALQNATVTAVSFAADYVSNTLPAEYAYIVDLNQSHDEDLKADETVFPTDPSRVGSLASPLSLKQTADLLWREERVPEWIDISVIYAATHKTILSLECCGRFTNNGNLLYYREGGVSPFGIKSPRFPKRWDESLGKFELNSMTREISPS